MTTARRCARHPLERPRQSELLCLAEVGGRSTGEALALRCALDALLRLRVRQLVEVADPASRLVSRIDAVDVARIGVVGLGTMGAGIAQVGVEAGFAVVGSEVSQELAERARERIAHFLQRKVDKGQLGADARAEALGRLSLTTDLSQLASCDLVIEAIVEDLEAKRALFAELDRIVGPDAVLATNTSALSVTELAAATAAPERVVGMHFFNPAPLMPLVEIVRAQLSAEEAVETAFRVAERMGKRPIRCHDTPGFVVNRILIPLLNDCIRVLDEARIAPDDLDTAMTAGAGWPMGPCRLVDLVGIDVHVHASEALYAKLREPRMAPPPRLVAMCHAGLLGRKSGRGFYSYD
jgi:3-hydroxybutyryl-CoA dehydrogenase